MSRILTHGKCILAGEHAVVRDSPALVFPLRSRSLVLEWEESDVGVFGSGALAEPFRAALSRALEILGAELPRSFRFHLESDIPLRAGLGSSAALSVAVARFLSELGVSRGDVFPLALELENLFHGTSSGIDVAAALSDAPILFRKGKPSIPLQPKWQPHLYLHDTGLRSSTKQCVEKVAHQNAPAIDEEMRKAVSMAKLALHSPDGVELLADAMNLAASCFAKWDLVPAGVRRLSDELLAKGALAVKPTGSGDGGFLLALWAGAAPLGLPISGP